MRFFFVAQNNIQTIFLKSSIIGKNITLTIIGTGKKNTCFYIAQNNISRMATTGFSSQNNIIIVI